MKRQETIAAAGAQAQMSDDGRPRPCPYCLQWLTKRFERHIRRCSTRYVYDKRVKLVSCRFCKHVVANFRMKKHQSICRLKHFSQLSEDEQVALHRRWIAIDDRRQAREDRRSRTIFVRSGTRSGTECRHQQSVLAIVPMARYKKPPKKMT